MQLLPAFHPCFSTLYKVYCKATKKKNLIADVQHGPFSRNSAFNPTWVQHRLSAWCPSVRLFYHFGMDPVFFQLSWAQTVLGDSSAERSYPVQSHRDRGQTGWSRRIKWVEPCYQLGRRGSLCLSLFRWCHILFVFVVFCLFFGFPLQSHSKLI